MLILLMWIVRVGGLEAKCLYCLCKGSIHLKRAFKSVKYHLTVWSKAIYEKISHIHP